MIVDIFCVVLLSSTTESIGCSIGVKRIVLTDSVIPGQAYRMFEIAPILTYLCNLFTSACKTIQTSNAVIILFKLVCK